jgi:hypothetical protein
MVHPGAGGFSGDDIEELRGLREDLDARLDELLETDKSPGWRRREVMAENLVPFLTRRARSDEMKNNMFRAISDGHLDRFPRLEHVTNAFILFADRAEFLNFHKIKSTRRKSGSKPSERDELLELFHRAWVTLRELESDGFPLMEYVETRA